MAQPIKLPHKPNLDRDIKSVCDSGITIKAAEQVGEGEPKKLPTFQIRAYNGGSLRVGNFKYPVIVDLSGLSASKKSRPALLDHDNAKRVGHTTEVNVSEESVDIAGIVSSTSADAQEVVQSSLNGFPWQASVGLHFPKPVQYLAAGKRARVNNREFEGPAYIAGKSVLKEISFTPLGVDDDTSARIAASKKKEITMDPKFIEWLEAKGFDAENLEDSAKSALKAMYETELKASVKPPEKKKEEPKKEEQPSAEAKAVEAALKADQYVTDVRDICAKYEGPEIEVEGKKTKLFAHALTNKWDTNKVELEAMRASRPESPAIHQAPGAPNSDALEASLCLQLTNDEEFVKKQYGEKTLEAATSKQARGVGLQYLMHEAIRQAGGSVHPGASGDALIAAYDQSVLRAAAGPSSISLPGILSNLANKSALQSFLAVPTTWREFCRTRSMNDFKQHTSYRLTAAGTFLKVGKDGEIKAAELKEETYANQLDTYARRFAFTRQDIINDDLGMLESIRSLLGRQAALSLEEAVFAVLMDNSDDFFHADNNNLATVALEIAGLTVVAQMFMDQQDADGKPILLGADRLLVPTSLAVPAQQLYSDLKVVGQGADAAPVPEGNPHAGAYRPVPTPYLNSAGMPNSDANDWYMFADPSDIAAMEVGFLNGVSTPTIESQQAAFEVLGIVLRGYFDFGVAKVDSRAAVKSEVT